MIKEYPYKKTSITAIRKAVRFAQNQLNLRDWQIDLSIGSTPLDGLTGDNKGGIVYSTDTLTATLWINEPLCREENFSMLDIVFHEVAHIHDKIRGKEFRCNTISNLLMCLYE